MKEKISYLIYVLIAKRLPISYNRFGQISKKIRYMLAKRFIRKCGDNVNFEMGATFGTDLEIGNNSGVGINARLSKGVKIGENVMMAPDVVILTVNHNIFDTGLPMIQQGDSVLENVVIEDDVWIGQRVIILPGVKLKKGVVVGAGSVVTKTFPEYSIIAGNPARIIKSRK